MVKKKKRISSDSKMVIFPCTELDFNVAIQISVPTPYTVRLTNPPALKKAIEQEAFGVLDEIMGKVKSSFKVCCKTYLHSHGEKFPTHCIQS